MAEIVDKFESEVTQGQFLVLSRVTDATGRHGHWRADSTRLYATAEAAKKAALEDDYGAHNYLIIDLGKLPE